MDFSKEKNRPIDQLFVVRKELNVKSELKKNIVSLYSYIASKLKIQTIPKIIFRNDKKNSTDPLGMTGHYDPSKKIIYVNITGRHDSDILRTAAHEIIHHWQNERGTLGHSAMINGHYAQEDNNLRKREMEAYLFGNILMRDWKDEINMGKPKIEPFLPQTLNENLQIDNLKLKDEVVNFVNGLVSKKILTSYHRELSSGDMNPNDFVDELSQKILKSIHGWIYNIEDKSNYESGTPLIK